MKNFKRTFDLNLRLFDGEGGGGAPAGAAEGNQGIAENQTKASLGKKQKGETVVYGKQEPNAEEKKQSRRR